MAEKQKSQIKEILKEVRQTRQVQVEVLDRAGEAAKVLEDMGVTHVKIVQNYVQFEFRGDDTRAAELLKALHDNGFHVCFMSEMEADLEEVFIRVTEQAEKITAATRGAE